MSRSPPPHQPDGHVKLKGSHPRGTTVFLFGFPNRRAVSRLTTGHQVCDNLDVSSSRAPAAFNLRVQGEPVDPRPGRAGSASNAPGLRATWSNRPGDVRSTDCPRWTCPTAWPLETLPSTLLSPQDRRRTSPRTGQPAHRGLADCTGHGPTRPGRTRTAPSDPPGVGGDQAITVELQPYFAWANRGDGTMRVWIPRPDLP